MRTAKQLAAQPVHGAQPALVLLAPMVRGALAAALGLLLMTPPAMAQRAGSSVEAGPGLRTDEAAWPRWQGRLGIATGIDMADRFDRQPSSSLSLFGDYYFLQQGTAAAGRYGGGFRATGGVLVGPRGMAWAGPPDSLATLGAGFSAQRRSFSLWNSGPSTDGSDTGSVPYVGVGYTGLKSLKATGGGWGFSADLGVMALQPRSAVRLGQQSVSDALRDLQLSPLLQLGVSYSF